jgi:hypothetical protein
MLNTVAFSAKRTRTNEQYKIEQKIKSQGPSRMKEWTGVAAGMGFPTSTQRAEIPH